MIKKAILVTSIILEMLLLMKYADLVFTGQAMIGISFNPILRYLMMGILICSAAFVISLILIILEILQKNNNRSCDSLKSDRQFISHEKGVEFINEFKNEINFCGFCGAKVKDSSTQCIVCGKKIIDN